MLEHWNEKKEGAKVNTVPHDTAKLALHVLTGAGFGMTHSFRGSLDTPRDGYRLTYRDSLEIAMGDVILMIVVPAVVYSLPWLPEKLANYKMAVGEFRRYLREMVAAAKVKALEGAPAEPDLLNTLVQKSQAADMGKDAENSNSQNGLSDDEIYGNLFMFSFAGHETTANALAYAIYLFAAFPEWQEWVGVEVEEVFKGHGSIDTLNYEELYPQLKRCGAIMVSFYFIFAEKGNEKVTKS
jgi:cytochrome P450